MYIYIYVHISKYLYSIYICIYSIYRYLKLCIQPYTIIYVGRKHFSYAYTMKDYIFMSLGISGS